MAAAREPAGSGPAEDAGSDPSAPPRRPLRIRPARAPDLPGVLEVERASFTLPWSPPTFRSLIGRERVLFLVAEEDPGSARGDGPTDPAEGRDPGPARDGPVLPDDAAGRVAGYGVLWWAADEGELANLAVAPRARRQGVASRLLEALLEAAAREGLRSVFLEVRVSNREAIDLYRKRGFLEVGRRRRYYTRPVEDALVLRLEL